MYKHYNYSREASLVNSFLASFALFVDNCTFPLSLKNKPDIRKTIPRVGKKKKTRYNK